MNNCHAYKRISANFLFDCNKHCITNVLQISSHSEVRNELDHSTIWAASPSLTNISYIINYFHMETRFKYAHKRQLFRGYIFIDRIILLHICLLMEESRHFCLSSNEEIVRRANRDAIFTPPQKVMFSRLYFTARVKEATAIKCAAPLHKEETRTTSPHPH